MSSVLIFDNYDSFTYNLVHLVEQHLHAKVDVCKNDEYSIERIGQYKKIILSPGPGLPDEAGLLKQVISTYGPTHSLLGVCLGHQAIAEVYGAKLINLESVFHGVATNMLLTENESVIFKDFPKTFKAGRYHSWVVDEGTLPLSLEVLAYDEAGSVMAIRHKHFDIHGVQFHPESIMTEHGEKLLHNWLFD